MKTAIRYYSKFGHTTKMAKIVGELTGTRPELATVRLAEPVDTLYLGSSAIIKSPVPQMREMLQARGITVSDKEFTCRGSMGPVHMGHPNMKDLEDFRQFIRSTL